MFNRLFHITAFALTLLVVVGCSDGRPKRVPVSGVVTIEGQPLTGDFVGFVRFCPTFAGRPAQAKLDSQGRFVLGNYEHDDGAPLGEYRVVVNISEQKNMKMRYMTPPRFWTSKTTPIVVSITGKTEDLTINVEWTSEDASYKNKWFEMND